MNGLSKHLSSICVIVMYTIIWINYKRIYINLTKDYDYKALKKFKLLITIGSSLAIFSALLLIIVKVFDLKYEILFFIGPNSFILSAVPFLMALKYGIKNGSASDDSIKNQKIIKHIVKIAIIIGLLSMIHYLKFIKIH